MSPVGAAVASSFSDAELSGLSSDWPGAKFSRKPACVAVAVVVALSETGGGGGGGAAAPGGTIGGTIGGRLAVGGSACGIAGGAAGCGVLGCGGFTVAEATAGARGAIVVTGRGD
jgi:hypothetical protein